MQQVTAPKSEGLGFKGMPPVKGFHLTKGRRPDAAKRPNMACQGVIQHGRHPDANALHRPSDRVGAFTIHVRAALLP